ncbi:unnamed protein product [Closterium sp. NIES-53]
MDQYLHRADAQRTTHEAAGGRGSHDCAAAAGADHHRSYSAAQRCDQLRHCLCRLRHLLYLRHHRRCRSLLHHRRRLHCRCRHLHLHHHSHHHPHPLHCLHHQLHLPRLPHERSCPPCSCQCGDSR